MHRSVMSYCLGVESTADDFSVGIPSSEGKILANVISAYIPEKGGIHPREAARHHAQVAGRVLAEAFQEARIQPEDVSVVAFSQGQGLRLWKLPRRFRSGGWSTPEGRDALRCDGREIAGGGENLISLPYTVK